tara:strand:+ start:99 stop:1115 length:1017 start_codon:yes stop_codon:yes gene_type:complete
VILPEEYVSQKFYQLAGYVKHKRYNNVYEGGCPICREGKSWGRKRRLYYIAKQNYIFCHNCGWTGDPFKFIQQIEGISFKDILGEAKDYDLIPFEEEKVIKTYRETATLPADSINLFDSNQTEYYKDDKTVQIALDYIKERKLDVAVNKPKSMWLSLKDYTHKNRLVIPFYDLDNKITFYQTRTLLNQDNKLPKYLSKIGSEKSLFSINTIDPSIDKIFIAEGPIDACFIKNCVAVAGIQETSETTFTPKQDEQLDRYKFHDKIWVLDSQHQDRAAKLKTRKLIEQGQTVFIWPSKYGTIFKDFNDMCLGLNISEIPYKFILDNTYTGPKAMLKLGSI